jgi:hypothetical protein
LALAAILVVMACQFCFLIQGCHWDVSGDEAEFWAWSRRLDWSYYARGPVIAWLIRLATEVCGELSQRLTGSLMFALRLPAILLGGLTAWGVFRLGELATGDRKAALLAVLLLPAVPALAIGGVLITCDTPLVCCWTWTAVWSLRGLRSDDTRPWLLAGLCGALGVLAKYTALALPAAIGAFLVFCPWQRRQLARPGFWAMSTLCVVLGMAPIVAWNALHDWVGFGQLADRVGFSDRSTWGRIGPVLAFLGGDAAALGVVWWVAGLRAVGNALPRIGASDVSFAPAGEPPGSSRCATERTGLFFLVCLWGVMWLACFAASVLGETEANWMVPGYIPLVVLIGHRASGLFARGPAAAGRYVAAWTFCLAAVIAIHHTEWFYPVVARWTPAPTKRWPAPMRRFDPTCRMRGHGALAQAVEARLAALKAQGKTPFIMTATYALTSTLSFYLPGHPEAYCLSWSYGMTPHPVSQHDLWHPNPRHDSDFFRGRSALVVDDANMPPNFAGYLVGKGVFGCWEYLERVVVRDGGVVVGAWDLSLCHDYKGIAGYKQNSCKRF